VGLMDPGNADSRAAESIQALLHKFRQFLLQSHNKVLNKFEENIRSLPRPCLTRLDNNPSLLDMRNYLFSRQCSLLLLAWKLFRHVNPILWKVM
jgi:hypothetical protein